jgi:hypothetical protein
MGATPRGIFIYLRACLVPGFFFPNLHLPYIVGCIFFGALDYRALVLQVRTYAFITARMNQKIRYGFENVHDRNHEVD